MASSIVGEKRTGGSGAVTKRQGGGISYRQSIEYLVYSDDRLATRDEIIFYTPGLPKVNVTRGVQGDVCVEVSAERREEHANYWDVKCEFETVEDDQQQPGGNPDTDNPTEWIPIFKIDSFTTKDVVMYEDKTPDTAVAGTDFPTGQFAARITATVSPPFPLTNSALQPFANPVVDKKTLAQMSFTQYEEATASVIGDLKTFLERNECVNTAAFNGFAKRTLLCNIIGAEKGYYNGYLCWRISYRLTYDPDTWDLFIDDTGTRYWDGTKWVAYRDGENKPITEGWLDGNAGKVTDNDSAPFSLRFRVKDEISFSFIRTN